MNKDNSEQKLDKVFFTGKRKYDRLREFFGPDLLNDLDEETKRQLQAKIRETLANPKESEAYRTLEIYGIDGEPANEAILKSMLQSIERDQLFALAFLGEIEIIPRLAALLGEVGKDIGARAWKEIYFGLKYLTGYDFPCMPPYTSYWANWWKKSELAFKLAPLETRLKLIDLGEWPLVLKKIIIAINNLNRYAKNYQRKPLMVDNRVEYLYDDLVKWVPQLSFDLLWDFLLPFEQKITLNMWFTKLTNEFQQKVLAHEEASIRELATNELLGQPRNLLMPSVNIHSIEIWSDQDTLSADENGLVGGSLYWNSLFFYLDLWRRSIEAILVDVKWHIDVEAVEFITTWRLPIKDTEKLNIKGAKNDFWLTTFQMPQSDYRSAVANALLLNLQLIIQRGGNKLLPTKKTNNQLILKLKMPRADITSTKSPDHPITKNVIEQIVYYMLDPILPNYAQASQKLEFALKNEIERICPHIPNCVKVEEGKRIDINFPGVNDEEGKLIFDLEDALAELVWVEKNIKKIFKTLET